MGHRGILAQAEVTTKESRGMASTGAEGRNWTADTRIFSAKTERRNQLMLLIFLTF